METPAFSVLGIYIYIFREKYIIETYKRRLEEKDPNENIKTEKSKLLEIEYLYSKDILLLELGPREATKTNPNSRRNKLFNEFLQKMMKQVNLITLWRKKDEIIKSF